MDNYYYTNRERLLKLKKQYYIKNREQILENLKNKNVNVLCKCGCMIKKSSLVKHKKSNKHINIMKSNQIVTKTIYIIKSKS